MTMVGKHPNGIINHFIRESSASGWIAFLSAILLLSLAGRGFVNTPEYTVTPLEDYSKKTGLLQKSACVRTSTGKRLLYFEVQGMQDNGYQASVPGTKCAELAAYLKNGDDIEYWVHPGISNWVGQIKVNQKMLVPHSYAYEEAWRARWNTLWVCLFLSSLLIYYSIKGQFEKWSRHNHTS